MKHHGRYGRRGDDMNVLVTGGAGYIGSHTVLQLLKQDCNVVVYDNLSTGNRWAIENIKKSMREKIENGLLCELEEGNIADESKLTEVILKYKQNDIVFDGVIHFAASSLVGESVTNPEMYYENNVIASKRLFDTLRKCDIKNIIFSSSCAVYGIPEVLPISEQEKKNPINTYGWTKLMIEQILNDYCRAYEFNAVSLRYFNAVGAAYKHNIGEAHTNETHVIPVMLRALTNNNHGFSVFGIDYDTRDGSCIRDYINVEDLATAHILALEKIANKERKSNSFDFYNLGTGIGTSVLELIDAIELVTGLRLNVIEKERREGDPAALIADNKKAEKELKWKPRKVDVRQSIEEAFLWEKIYQEL